MHIGLYNHYRSIQIFFLKKISIQLIFKETAFEANLWEELHPAPYADKERSRRRHNNHAATIL